MSGSYYTLNSKYNQLKSILAGLPISGSGLTADLNANNYDILNVDNITLNTINGLPPAGAENLEQTLTIGDDANGLNIQNLNQLGLQGGSTITDSTGDLVLQPPTNQTLQLGNNIYVDTQTNRVGINVPVPTEDLEIDGNIQMNTGATSKIVFYDSPNDHEHAEIDAEGEGTNGGALKFQTKEDGGAVSEKLRIDNIGRLGLGGANYGTSGQVLTSNGATAPTWETLPPADPSVVETDTDATYYPVFVDGAGSGKILRADTTTTPISVNPNTGDFNVVDTIKIDTTKNNVALGKSAGEIDDYNIREYAVAIGNQAGQTNQQGSSVAIGRRAGQTLQSNQAVAIGWLAGNNGQSGSAVAVGYQAGENSQGSNSVAIGLAAAESSQGGSAVAIGREAGKSTQGSYSVAIGNQAGELNQGAYCVAIGNNAGYQNQGARSIVINASSGLLNNTGTDRFIVKPVRDFGTETGFRVLYYNPSTGEIAYT